jgi:hypothetical protein
LAALLLLGLFLRVEGIRLDLIDHHCFREGTEAMMARHFDRQGLAPQYPQICGYAASPLIFVNEFPLYPLTVAAGYRLFGEHILLARLVSIVFSLGTAVLVFFLLRRFCSNSAPLWGTLLFVLSPLGSYAGRCVLRHPMAFLFMVLAFYLWVLWVERPGWLLWGGVWLSAAITILMNFANAYIGLPMLAVLLAMRGGKALLDRRIWVLAGLVLLPSVLWLKHASEFGAWFLTGPGGVQQRSLGQFIGLTWLDAAFFKSLGFHLWHMLLTPAGCLLALGGLLISWRSPFAWVVRIWALTVFVYFGFDHYPIAEVVHDYYFLHALVPACLAFGLAAGWLVEKAGDWIPLRRDAGHWGMTAVLLVITLFSWYSFDRPLKKNFLEVEAGWLRHWTMAGKRVQETIPQGTPIVVDRAVDALIYLCDHPGWVTDWQTLTEESLRSLIAHGAEYLLITSYTMGGPDQYTGYQFYDESNGSPAAAWVRAHGKVIQDASIFQIVDLIPESR